MELLLAVAVRFNRRRFVREQCIRHLRTLYLSIVAATLLISSRMEQELTPPPPPLPLLPGMRSTHYDYMTKTHFRRGQLLERMSVGKLTSTERAPPASFHPVVSAATVAKANEIRQTSITQPQPEVNRLRIPSTKYRADSTKPAWLTHDRLVLRFFSYFIEPIKHPDGRTEDRVRRVVICFYLSDCSISISEPRVINSGIAQGEFMRRTVVRKGKNSISFHRDSLSDDLYTPEDFRIGGELRLYGRVFHIVDCDAATRRFYAEALDKALETPRMYPDESGSKLDEVEELKTQLRDRTRALGASKAEATRKFHDLSQKVLRFFASWHDNHPLYPETRRFVLHYYLCDDTVEVIETRDSNRNHGRGHFSVMLSRRKLARDPSTRKQQNDDDEGSYFITDRDLRCGEWVDVFSRSLLLEDCDAFTRDYYLETHGITQEKFESSPSEASEAAAKWKLFQAEPLQKSLPPNYRGTTGYSANNKSCMESGLAAPIPENRGRGRSLATMICQNDELDKKQLRFRARFRGVQHGDINAQREFVLTFYLEDDTLAVFEPRVRNSGVLGGRFLDRARFRKSTKSNQNSDSTNPAHYGAADMFVGAVLTFEFSPHQQFELIEADSQTLSYCESHPEMFPFSDSSAVLAYVARHWLRGSSQLDLRREWRQLDRVRSHFVSMEEMQRVLTQAGLASGMNGQQMITLFRRFAVGNEETGDDGDNNQLQEPLFAYDEFCDVIAAFATNPTGGNDDNVRLKLMKIISLRHMLSQSRLSCGLATIDDLVRVTSDRSCSLSKSEIEMITARFATTSGSIDVHKLCDYVFQLPASQQQPLASEDIDNGITFADQSDEALPPELPTDRSTEWSSTPSPSTRKPANDSQTLSALTNPRVINTLQRVFAARKYQLRKAFRDRDRDRSGRLREDEFMEAIISVAPQMSDDDAYVLADAFFPTNNSCMDYPQLLDSAFRG